MASEFIELCEIYGLSPGDPEAIDKLIFLINRTDDSRDEEFYNDQGFFIDEELLVDDDEPGG
jgi:hypothetical protein